MRTFTDSTGQTWTLAITVDAIKRVRTLVSVDLTALTEGKPPLLTRLGVDVILLCDVLFALVKPQADTLKIDDVKFGQSLGGEVITMAADAFWQELEDFFQKLRRPDQVRAIQKQKDLIDAAVKAVEQKIENLQTDQVVDAAFSSSATKLQELLGSTPEA